MPTRGRADGQGDTPRHRDGVPLSRVFRARGIERGGRVVGCWFTVSASVEETPGNDRRGYGGHDDRGHRFFDLARERGDRTRTWCMGIALMLGPREAAGTWFEFEADMDDASVERRACDGSLRKSTPRPRDDPGFGEAVQSLRTLAGRGWRNTATGQAIATFDGGRATPGAVEEALADMRGHAAGFVATLDPGALALLDVGDEAIERGPWWGLDPGMGRGAPARAALERHPHLRREVLRAWQYECLDLAKAMSKGTELDFLSDFLLGRKRGEASRGPDLALAEAGCEAVPIDWEADLWGRDMPYDLPSAFKAVIRITGDDHKPRDPAGWAVALQAATGLRKAAHSVAGYKEAMNFVDTGGDWVAWAGRVKGEIGDRPLGGAIDDMDDLSKAFERQVIAPALLLAGRGEQDTPHSLLGRQVAASLLWSGRRLRRCLGLSARWHARRPAMDAAIARLPRPLSAMPEPPAASWRPGLPGLSRGDLELVVLTDGDQLADEGRHGLNGDGTEGLRHCVSGYGPECRSGRHRIASIRRRTGDGFVRVSTAEVVVDGEGRSFSVRQHRGRNNAAPPREADTLLGDYMAGLADGTLPVDRHAFVRLPGARSHADPADEAGYDWRAEGAWEAVSGLWQQYLPSTLRGLSPEGWAAVFVATDDEKWPTSAYWRPLPWEASEPTLAFPGY